MKRLIAVLMVASMLSLGGACAARAERALRRRAAVRRRLQQPAAPRLLRDPPPRLHRRVARHAALPLHRLAARTSIGSSATSRSARKGTTTAWASTCEPGAARRSAEPKSPLDCRNRRRAAARSRASSIRRVTSAGAAQAARLPQLRIHADRGEPGDGVELVDVEGAGAALEEEVDARHAAALERAIGAHGQCRARARASRRRARRECAVCARLSAAYLSSYE